MSAVLAHPTAVVDPAARIGEGTTIGAYAVVGPKAVIGRNCFIGPHCVIENLKCGDDNRFEASVYAGTPPQDIRHSGDEFFVVMGARNRVRECVTLNRGTKQDTVIGDDCYLMAYAHVAHDCKVGNGVILVNNATLAGHVTVGDKALLSGLSAVHQFVRVGRLAMLSGLSGAVQDLPPFCTSSGTRAGLAGLNVVGMRRGGVSREAIARVREAYKVLFLRGLLLKDAVAELKKDPTPEVQELAAFVEVTKRGIMRPRSGADQEAESE